MEFQRARESELGTIQQETTPKTTCGRGVHPLPLMGTNTFAHSGDARLRMPTSQPVLCPKAGCSSHPLV